MKALDTNVLARFFIDDPDDPQAVGDGSSARHVIRQGSAGVEREHAVHRSRFEFRVRCKAGDDPRHLKTLRQPVVVGEFATKTSDGVPIGQQL